MPKTLKNALNPKMLDSLTEPGRYSDGEGLALRIDKQGNKAWVQRVTRSDGKETMKGLGVYPTVSLAEARRASADLRQRMASGGSEPDVLTFADAAERFLEGWTGGGGSRRQRNGDEWRASFRVHVYPKLGHLPVDKITTGQVLDVLTPLWSAIPVTAKRLRQRMEKVFEWAIMSDHREKANPATKGVTSVLPKIRREPEHHQFLSHANVPAALRKIELSTAAPVTRLCYHFLILTATRSGETRGADWSEIDWGTATWVIPGERMKSGKQHRVPLSRQALGVLHDAYELVRVRRGDPPTGPDDKWPTQGLIFPTLRGRVMNANALSSTTKKLKMGAVPHGFRASFRNWCAENRVAREVAEASLAHTLGTNLAEIAYLHTDLLDLRRPVMQDWADLCTGWSAPSSQ